MSLRFILALAAAYLLGAVPWGYLIYRQKTGKDIRGEGSGNIGATNVARVAGKAAGIATLVLDVVKGYAAVWLAGWLSGGDRMWMSAAAVAVLVGHMFPVFLGFKGGKGVASALGAFGALSPLAVLATMAAFVLVVAVTRYVSLGSIVGAAAFPVAAWYLQQPPVEQTLGSIAGGALIIFKHHANIGRLLAGSENKLSFSGEDQK